MRASPTARTQNSSARASSKSAARRAIAEGGAYLNNRKVTSDDAAPTVTDLLHGRYLILRVGKRSLGAVEVVWR